MYQVLARKYRPRNFAELVGQEHVSQALSNALTRGRLHHAYLFTGTRGVGKTTIARILSKCLNCETGITATPCDVCPTCVAINQGRFIDLIEIDAASRTKVEDTRELLDNVPYAPTQGRYKVYLIDEVHMLSTHSFNALLKTLEEPPEHVKFLLATTDPQKLPVTVLSRCLQFTLRPLPQQSIHDHLADVLDKEQIGFDDRALWQLAEAAQGSLRDALSLTDQAIAYGQGKVQGQDVQDMLGLLDKSQVIQLLQGIHQNQPQQISRILQNLANQAVDLKAVLDQLVTLLHQVALVQLLPDVPIQGTDEFQAQIRYLANHIQAADLQLYYQIALQGRQDLKQAVTLQQGFDMCILRMLAFRPLSINEQLDNESSDKVFSPQIASPSESVASSDQNAFVAPTESTIEPDQARTVVQPIVESQPIIAAAVPIESIQQTYQTETIVPVVAVESQLQSYAPQSQIQPEEELSADEDYVEPAGLFDEPSSFNDSNAISNMDQQLDNQMVDVFQDGVDIGFNAASDVINDELVLAQPQTPPDSAQLIAHVSEQVVEPMLESLFEQSHLDQVVIKQHIAEQPVIEQQIVDAEQADLLPQQILQHEKVALEGEWTVEKWECWLREAEITPAVRNLAQHGLMQGVINAESNFLIEMQHRLMATELMDSLIEAVKQQWPASQVTLDFQKLDLQIPLHRKAIRAEKALQQAEFLLHKDPVVNGLVEQFGAKLIDIHLKE